MALKVLTVSNSFSCMGFLVSVFIFSELLTPPVKINDLRFVVRKEKMTKFPVQSMLCDATKTSHLPFRY